MSRKNSALILVHGRGATAEGIRAAVTTHAAIPDECLVLAPQAPGRTWYPFRFIEPKAKNQPFLSNALAVLDTLLLDAQEKNGIAPERVVFLGFSQGACLVSEYLKQNPRRYGGAVIASGGIIGSDAEADEPGNAGSLENTPIYIGCDNADAHIPADRVRTTERCLQGLGARVEFHLYDGLGHAVHPDAFEFLSSLLQ